MICRIAIHFVVLNLYVTGMILLVGKTPVNWFGFFLIVFGLVFTQLLCAAFLYANKLLNQK